MQDLKTGHLLAAAPNAQFWGQVIGATVGAVVSALVYQLYTSSVKPLSLPMRPSSSVSWLTTSKVCTRSLATCSRFLRPLSGSSQLVSLQGKGCRPWLSSGQPVRGFCSLLRP
jgi:hypothetical protein